MSSISQKPFGQLSDGRAATLFTLSHRSGLRVSISDFGGVITELFCPDKNGSFADVVQGFDSVEPYETVSPYFGALIGRFGNRIDGGRFTLDGVQHQLTVNDGNNHLHGGSPGFDKVLWQAEPGQEGDDLLLKLRYLSKDGEQGYPGNLQVEVLYRVTASAVITEFQATTDAATPVNLTQHSYFNLAGHGDILSHRLKIHADRFTPITAGLIPTGELPVVAETVFDFTQYKNIGEQIDFADPQLGNAGGYDHNFVLNKTAEGAFETAAEVVEPVSGRKLTVKTTEPGIQFYSGNFLDGTLTSKKNGADQNYAYRSGFCLEPQHFPDAPNQSGFPDTILRPGETYHSRMSFEFSISEDINE